MGKRIDLTGERFGRLVVVGLAYRAAPGRYYWDCTCTCGKLTVVAGMHLRSGNTTSCGCRKAETRTELHVRSRVHGQYGNATHRSWAAMLNRCRNPKSQDYADYGGRGIRVCARWLKFPNFVADMGPRPVGRTLERADVNGNYERSNCYWATPAQQARNKRNNRWITYAGEKRTLTEWAARAGKPASWLHKRLQRMPVAAALHGVT